MRLGKKNFYNIIGKKYVKNGVWLYGLQFFNTVLPLVTLPYITRVLGTAKYGTFSVVLNFVSYLQVVVEYGFALSATREVALISDDENNSEDGLSRIFTRVIFVRFLLFICCFAITFINIVIFNRPKETNLCFFVLSISLIGYVMQENWIFQGKQEMKFISICTIVARIITTLLIFICIKTPKDIVLYCVLYSLSPIIANIMGTIIAVKRYKLRLLRLKMQDIIDALRNGMYVFFTQLSSKVFGAIGITFLGIFASSEDVGIYSAIYKIPYVLMLLWNPIAQIIYPITSKKIVESNYKGYIFIKRIKKYILLLFGGISVLVGIFAKPITAIAFGSDYVQRFYIIYPLLLWMLLGINNNFEGIQTLVASGHDKEYSACFQVGVIGTIIFNYLLIYLWGINGAAMAPLISEGLLSILLHYRVRRVGTFTNL